MQWTSAVNLLLPGLSGVRSSTAIWTTSAKSCSDIIQKQQHNPWGTTAAPQACTPAKKTPRRYTEYTSDTYEMYRIYLWNTAHSRDAALRARSRDYPAHPSRRGNFPAPGLRQELGFPCFPLHIPQGSGIFRFTLTKLRKLQATPDLQILNLNRPLKSSWTQW